MGAASKTCSVILRLSELISAAVVAGLVGRYLYFLSSANAHASSRIIYAEVIAGIGILASLILLPPLKYSFYCFCLDFALFVCWMVAFGLLCNLTVSGGCGSFWYWNSWGYYWGRYWHTIPHSSITQSIVGREACSEWLATLAFSFIGGWCWFFSGFLGIYVCTNYSGDWSSSSSVMGHVSSSTRIAHWRHKTDREAAPNNESTITGSQV
ncbi:hypothetical protein BKA65DRAFT_500282 [Rhexocercosporidium sp. MPI-PUGE-AT-0058]|nr:hypothetical protein BKA65DRAFT_500282 [Rhexocercosporidium sp. MPI-PUGE-AT-0058]